MLTISTEVVLLALGLRVGVVAGHLVLAVEGGLLQANQGWVVLTYNILLIDMGAKGKKRKKR